MLAFQLVAKQPVDGLAIGDHVTDPVLVERYSRTRAMFFVRKPLEVEPSTSISLPATSSASTGVPKLTPIA